MDDVLGTDIRLVDGDIVASPTGDVSLVAGRQCLAQDLTTLLRMPRGAHWAHPELGCFAHAFVGEEDTELGRLELVQELARAIEADPRVEPGSARVEVLRWDRGRLEVRVSVLPIGEANPLNLVLGYGLEAGA